MEDDDETLAFRKERAEAEAAEKIANTGKTPVAICKWDRQEPIASMRIDYFIELLKIAYKGESNDGRGDTLV